MPFTLPFNNTDNAIMRVTLPNSYTLRFHSLFNSSFKYWTISIFEDDETPIRYCQPLFPNMFIFQNNRVLSDKYGDFVAIDIDPDNYDEDYTVSTSLGNSIIVDWYSPEEIKALKVYGELTQ